jgi:hypothetical protein
MSADERIEKAGLLYERAVFGGDFGGLGTAERELDAVEADLALAHGRIAHARFLEGRDEDPRELTLFERAAELYRTLGDARGAVLGRLLPPGRPTGQRRRDSCPRAVLGSRDVR